MVNYNWAGATDSGKSRNRNEDAVLPNDVGLGPGPVVVAVADGLGGHPGGDIASRLAVSAVSTGGGEAPRAADLIEAAQVRIRQHIFAAMDQDPALLEMATTLTLAVLGADGAVEIGHVGDSRAYLGDRTQFVQVTEDHTVAMDKVRAGELTIEQARRDPGWHTISNCLGMEPSRPETHQLELLPGERLLLCSDGLSNMVPDDGIAPLLFSGTPDASAHALISAANDAGGADNISVVVVEVTE
jgi:protein phosphatase